MGGGCGAGRGGRWGEVGRRGAGRGGAQSDVVAQRCRSSSAGEQQTLAGQSGGLAGRAGILLGANSEEAVITGMEIR